ncbi:hypothetical protein D1007_43520 [Hordeum vulgare]|nr:hypothetical protein D1007_43520 [Hordeum vulgare]
MACAAHEHFTSIHGATQSRAFSINLDLIDTRLFFLEKLESHILRPLTNSHNTPSISLFTDDIVIFCHPDPSELEAIHEILDTFGMASILRTNFHKCSITPIQCTSDIVTAKGTNISCPVTSFPIICLGLPLSISKLHPYSLLPLIEKLAKKFSSWCTSLFTRAERLALVCHVLIAMRVHLLLTMTICPTILKQATRIIRDFLWHGRKEAKAGN